MEKQSPVTTIVPWLYCDDLERSRSFYCDVLGFIVRGERPDECSAYLEYRGARVMLQQASTGAFNAGQLEHPYGRGVHLLIETDEVDALYARVSAADSVFARPRSRWYRLGEAMEGHREVVLKDPDGYLLRFYQRLEGLEDA